MILGLTDEQFQLELVIDEYREVHNFEFDGGETDPKN